MTYICSLCALIKVSRLHFGQYKGIFFNSVSSRIRSRVLLLQIGHKIQFSIILTTPPKLIVFFEYDL